MLFVRVKSSLEPDEPERRMLERRSGFLEILGLIQKIYGRDNATGHRCGIYFFETQDALEAFAATELAKSIPVAYEAVESERKSMRSCIR